MHEMSQICGLASDGVRLVMKAIPKFEATYLPLQFLFAWRGHSPGNRARSSRNFRNHTELPAEISSRTPCRAEVESIQSGRSRTYDATHEGFGVTWEKTRLHAKLRLNPSSLASVLDIFFFAI